MVKITGWGHDNPLASMTLLIIESFLIKDRK